MQYEGVIVGLGNPGQRYKNTRHNCGFALVDTLLQRTSQDGQTEELSGAKFSCLLWKIRLPLLPGWWLVAKPETFMNSSGMCVQPLLAWHKLAPMQLIVAHDELDIAAGELRFKRGGGNAGHNGLKSITQQLGTPDFFRLRIGIGRPERKDDVINWVLGCPSADDASKIKASLIQALDVLGSFATHGLEQAVCAAKKQQ